MEARVTQVLDYLMEPELLGWMLRSGPAKVKRVGDEAKIIGSAVDSIIYADIMGKGRIEAAIQPEVASHKSVVSALEAWAKFKVRYPEVVASVKFAQVELSDAEENVVGHPDIIVESDNEWGIIDVKTSKAIQPRYWTQTAKYADMYAKGRLVGPRIDKPRFIAILRLDKETGLFEYKRIDDEAIIRYEIEIFAAHLKLFRHNSLLREVIRKQLEAEVMNAS